MSETSSREQLRPSFPKRSTNFIPELFAYLFGWYGVFLGRYPYVILITALFVAGFCSTGLYRVTTQWSSKSGELQKLFLPRDSQAARDYDESEAWLDCDSGEKDCRRTLKNVTKTTTWPPSGCSNQNGDNEHIDTLAAAEFQNVKTRKKRYTGRNRYCEPTEDRTNCAKLRYAIMLVANDGFDFWTVDGIRQVRELENIIWNFSVPSQDGNVTYNQLCSMNGRECAGIHTPVLDWQLGNKGYTLEDALDPDAVFPVTFPIAGNANFDLTRYFGGVKTKNGGYHVPITSLKSFTIVLCVNPFLWCLFGEPPYDGGYRYVKEFNKFLRANQHTNSNFTIYYQYGTRQEEDDSDRSASAMLPQVCISFTALFIWCMVGSVSIDVVRSKPYIGLIGVSCTFIACASGIGVMLWLDNPFYPFIAAVPILTLAIGLDDMFILLAAWGRTNPRLETEERMMLTMEEGGTSILITFFINVIGFFVGTYAPYPAINILSAYSIATMSFDFIFQMTILTSCLSIFGRGDSSNTHSLCCCLTNLPLREEADEDGSTCDAVCCSGGVVPQEEILLGDEDEDLQAITRLLLDYYAPFILHAYSRIGIFLLYICYLGGVLYLATTMNIGLKVKRLLPESSSMFEMADVREKYYSEYAHHVTLTVMTEVDYTDPVIQQKLDDMLRELEQSGYFWDREVTQWWLPKLQSWQRMRQVDCSKYCATAPPKCAFSGCACCARNHTVLVQQLLMPDGIAFMPPGSSNFHDYGEDVALTPKIPHVVKRSRMHIRAKNSISPQRKMDELAMVQRVTAKMETRGIKVVAESDTFLVTENFLTIFPTTMYYTGVTLACTLVATMLMLPHLVCVFWSCIGLISTVAGILGLMTLWDVDLDTLSMNALLIAIGFAADYLVHGIFLFLKSEQPDGVTASQARAHKAKMMIANVGTAALPAAMGTFIALIPFGASDAYMFYVFFRIMVLSMALSLLQALVFLPVFLSFFGPVDSSPPPEADPESKQYNDAMPHKAAEVSSVSSIDSHSSASESSHRYLTPGYQTQSYQTPGSSNVFYPRREYSSANRRAPHGGSLFDDSASTVYRDNFKRIPREATYTNPVYDSAPPSGTRRTMASVREQSTQASEDSPRQQSYHTAAPSYVRPSGHVQQQAMPPESVLVGRGLGNSLFSGVVRHHGTPLRASKPSRKVNYELTRLRGRRATHVSTFGV